MPELRKDVQCIRKEQYEYHEQGQSSNKQTGQSAKNRHAVLQEDGFYRCNADIFPASRNTHIFQVYGQAE